MKLFSLANILCLLLLAPQSIKAIQVVDKPNIVFILADDLGYGDVQCLNPQRGKIATPHMDQVAAEGMTFLDAHTTSSVCTPTRYSIMTGRYNWRTKLQTGVLSRGSGGWTAPKEPAALKLGLPKAQLYDLSSDASEQNNMYPSHPELAERLQACLLYTSDAADE